MLDTGKKTCSILLFVRIVCFFFGLVCGLCLSRQEQKAQRNAVPVDGPKDGHQGHPAELQLRTEAGVTVARAVPRAAQSNGAVPLFLGVRTAPGQLHPVQVGLGRSRGDMEECLVRESVHFEEQGMCAGHSTSFRLKFMPQKKVFSFFFYLYR